MEPTLPLRMAASLKRPLPGTGFVDGKRRAVTDLASVPISRTAGSLGDLDQQKSVAELVPPTKGAATEAGPPSSTALSAAEQAEARLWGAPVPPAECVCAGGCQNSVADDVYGLHFRCTECQGMTTPEVHQRLQAEKLFRSAPLPPPECVCAGGCQDSVADDVYGLHFRCTECQGMTTPEVHNRLQAEKRLWSAPSPPTTCTCSGCKSPIRDDVYGLHFRCSRCDGLVGA